MTDRLYYNDSSLLEFEGTIVNVDQKDGKYLTTLDRSAFYPTSGGQQFDTGTLNDIAIIDVREDDDGSVVHYSEKPAGKIGDQVRGRIDKHRRQRHCRLHTAQHILSHITWSSFELLTVSVHLGEEYGAVELEGRFLPADEIVRVEDRANEIIRESLPVEIIFAAGDDIAKIPLRKPPKRSGKIRVINIGGLEYSACGGTHCRNTSELGLIKLIGVEKLRGHMLIKFLVGELAIADYRARFDVTARLSKKLTCHISDLPDKVDSLTAEQKKLKHELSAVYKELLPLRAGQLAEPVIGKAGKLVCAVTDLPDPKLLMQLAPLVAEKICGVALLGQDSRLVAAVSGSSEYDARLIVKTLSEKFGIKGGGSRTLAQMGGADMELLSEYERFIKALMENNK